MDYGGGDHKTADQGCVWPFAVGQILWAKSYRAYRLFARSVCDVQCRCSCSCRLWFYINVMPLPFTFLPLGHPVKSEISPPVVQMAREGLRFSCYVVYRVPATGSPIPKDHVPANAMIGWHVARHWAAAQFYQYGVDI